MTSIQIIQAAMEYHKLRGGKRPPGVVAEQMYQDLVKDWLAHTKQFMITLEDDLDSTLEVTVAGYRSYHVVQCAGDDLIPLPSTTVELDNPSSRTGFVVRGETMTFLGYEEGDAYEINYFSDYADTTITAAPACPEQTHMMLVNELAWSFWRFGPVALTAGDLLDRRHNEKKFKYAVSSRTTDVHTPLQPDPMWIRGSSGRSR